MPFSLGTKHRAALEERLCAYVSAHVLQLDPSAPPPTAAQAQDVFGSFPQELHPLLSEGYLPTLSEEFSRSSHEGNYDRALSSGRTLLALYAVLYPHNYPQIGERPEPVAIWIFDPHDTHCQGRTLSNLRRQPGMRL